MPKRTILLNFTTLLHQTPTKLEPSTVKHLVVAGEALLCILDGPTTYYAFIILKY